MLEDLCRSVALHGVHVEHPQHQVLGRRGDRVPVAAGERDLSLPNPRQDVLRRVLWSSCKRSGSATRGGTSIIIRTSVKFCGLSAKFLDGPQKFRFFGGCGLTRLAWCTVELQGSRYQWQHHILVSSAPNGVGTGLKFTSGGRGGGQNSDLGGHEICGVAGGHEQPVLGPQLLGKSEIGNSEALGLAGRTGVEEIGWLQIPVDHALLVQEVNG